LEEVTMSQGTVLVTAATGFTGGAAVEELLARGRHVRALAHREDARSKRLQELGAEVVFGDFLDLDAIRAAVHEAGMDGVVNMSQACARADAKSHAMGDHWLAELVFDWSGLTVAHLRPTLFAESLLVLAPMIRAGLLHVPFGTGRHAPIAAEDQARVIVGILEDPASHRGKTYPLYRPVEFTHEEIAQVLSRVLGKDVQYQQVSLETMLQFLTSGDQKPPAEHSARGLYGEFEQKPECRTGESFLTQHLREVAIDDQNGVFAGANDVVKRIGGRQPTTLEEFITKHRQALA
jgi:uncharacterized protein YbjT (DUF2867 family)